ncbi:HAD-IIIC family phosphatase [Pedobacter sp.]
MNFNSLKKNLKKDFSPKHQLKLAILGDTATQFLSTAIAGYAVEKAIKLDIYEAPYNQIALQFKNPISDLHDFKPNYILIFEAETKLKDDFYKTAASERTSFAENKIETIKEYIATAKQLGSNILYFNFCEVDDGVYGNYAAQYPESFIYQCRQLNFELGKLASETSGFYLVDLLSQQSKYGINFIKDNQLLIQADMYFTLDFLPIIAKNVIDIISVRLGDLKKCLILDLDNTTWGGIIGDDGINNIQIGGLGIGKAFTKLQYWAKELKNRGIILCVASKNTENIALEPFQLHQEMVLKEDDISVFMANWDNKVTNIQKIQEILNIGFDSMVFLDDNPFEREMVKQNLPLVTVPDLPENPAEYLNYINSLNLFEAANVTQLDNKRTVQYKEEANRVKAKTYFENEDAFLQSLAMACKAEPITAFSLPRIAQLSLRSNQFNLRTVRFDEESLTNYSSNPNHQVISFSLKDKYGDYGLIAALFLEKRAKELFIDNWIMSCRVLKRGMEKFTLNHLVDFAKTMGCDKIVGEYLPTPKNALVKDHYQDLGFKPNTTNDSLWILDITNYQPFEVQIQTII